MSNRLNSKLRRRIMARVIERDGGVCWLCDLPVDMSLQYPHPLSKTMDHVLPRADGGNFRAVNLRLAHKVCNEARAEEEIRHGQPLTDRQRRFIEARKVAA